MKYLTSNTAALPYIQLMLTLVIAFFAIFEPQSVGLWCLSVLMYVIIGAFGISVGYHRLLTHKSFKTNKFWEYWCTLWGCLALTGSSIGWVGVHRDHHAYSDKPGDPHSPANVGLRMLVAAYDFEPKKWTVRRLITDKFHLFVHKYYFGLIGAWSIMWLCINPTLLMHVVLIPGCISIWVSTISNYMNHKWGYVTYPARDNSRNNWLNALFTFGEGWHNNHHARPGEWNFGHRWWELDPGSWIIRLIKK